MIYFCRMGESGPVKIGWCDGDDPEWAAQRVAALQIGCPEQLVLLGTIEGGRDGEAYLHRHFASQRVRGEWFEPSASLLEIANRHPYSPPAAKPPKPKSVQVAFSCPPEVLEHLDSLRGLVPRSLWIREAVQLAFENLVEINFLGDAYYMPATQDRLPASVEM